MELQINSQYVENLQGLITIPTVSNADEDKVNFDYFFQLHQYLEETYPLIHKTMTKNLIGKASLLFYRKAKNPKKLPVLLMAHQDVVPVGDVGKWKYDPFSARIAEGCIWGRGTTDCKGVMLSELEAVEKLIAEGFEPDYDIYLAYGHNEEVQAKVKGALLIVDYLAAKGVRLGYVFDEGGNIKSGTDLGYEGYIAQIAMGEKAYVDYEIYQDTAGGHSMEPGAGTALGAVAKGIVAIEDNPLPYRLTPLVKKQLQARSHYLLGKEREIFADPESHWAEIMHFAKTDKKLDSILHTTMAVTMASGSEQSNVLPSHAGAIVNCRLLQGDTVESIGQHIASVLPEGVFVRKLVGDNPELIPEVTEETLRLLKNILQQIYGDNIVVVPALLAGGTDSRFFSKISNNVFRFGALFRDERWGQSHQVDEKIPCDVLESGVRFFELFLRSYADSNAFSDH